MDRSVLVTYGSKYGATKEIAERVGDVLRQTGMQVDVLAVDVIRDLGPYQAVILGSALYVGKWHKGAAAFLRANEAGLMDRPVWMFSSGPTGEGDPFELVEGKSLPADLQPIADRVQPRDIAVFHGFIDPEKVNLVEKWAIKSLVKKPFGDFRDWNAIVAWSIEIADALRDGEHSH